MTIRPPTCVPLLGFLTATTAAVFALDWITPLGFAVFMLYVPICLASLWLGGWRVALVLGILCSLLLVIGLLVSPPGGSFIWSFVNRSVAFFAIWSALWGGKMFAKRSVELERAHASLRQEAEQRTHAEQALRLANEELDARVTQRTAELKTALDRWELVTQATHDGVYDWDLTTRLVVYSSHWKEMHGLDGEGGHETIEQWSARIHPDDRIRVLSHLDDYLAKKRQEFREEYRICRGDRSWMWILDRGIALWDEAGRAVRMVGSEKDITERKQAEAQLRQHQAQLEALTENLLKAQDHERQRIARELHDDITQRLAVLAVEIGSLERSRPSDARLEVHLASLRKTAAQLADDVHNFAYRLHPSLLEHLGLEAAVRDHVDEFRRRSGLDVQYVQRGVPKSLPMDVATCLYRVTQESLQNVLKHAEASKVLIRLLGTAAGVGVCIRDDGMGFDPDATEPRSGGLGLISMEERVRLLKGRFRVQSHLGDGAEVHAWVPWSGMPPDAPDQTGPIERLASPNQ
ncbi:MAG: PAS domain-containing protein [Nitrospira sp.]|nr:PAS domain-containing protein [Nitrospira sp.]